MAEILRMDNITKVYPNGVLANKDVTFSLEEGEIHALMGENGAGKSTLMKILFGLERPSSGDVFLRGNKVDITSPNVALNYEIGMVHQHFMLVPSLTVAENIVLGIEPRQGFVLDLKAAIKQVSEISEKYNFSLNPKAIVNDLPVASRQKIEILKSLIRGAKILILDEPTAVLTPQETEELFKQLVKLKQSGLTIIFISHKLKEVKDISDRITVMRNGKSEGTHNTSEITQEEISRLMVGRDIVSKIDKDKPKPKEVVLSVDNVQYNDKDKALLKNISFNLKGGTILGIAGVEGNGQREIVDIITGSKKPHGGSVRICGNDISNLDVKKIRDLGVSYIPEDRMTLGVAKDAPIWENLISDRFDKKENNKRISMNLKKLKNLSIDLVKEYLVKCSSIFQPVSMLSGGNIQKVVVARELSSNPELLIAEQPTRGIDIGASTFIRKKVVELRDKGVAVLLFSADLNEIMELSDNLIVMYNGEITAFFENAAEVTEEELGLHMLGLKKSIIGKENK